jgi:hypothetical protein
MTDVERARIKQEADEQFRRSREEREQRLAMPAPVVLAEMSIRELEARASALRKAIAEKRRAAIGQEEQRIGWRPLRGRSHFFAETTGPSEAEVLLLQADTLAAEVADILEELRDRRDAQAKAGERLRMWLTIAVAAIATAGTLVQAWAVYRPPSPPAAVQLQGPTVSAAAAVPAVPPAPACDRSDLLTTFLCAEGQDQGPIAPTE